MVFNDSTEWRDLQPWDSPHYGDKLIVAAIEKLTEAVDRQTEQMKEPISVRQHHSGLGPY